MADDDVPSGGATLAGDAPMSAPVAGADPRPTAMLDQLRQQPPMSTAAEPATVPTGTTSEAITTEEEQQQRRAGEERLGAIYEQRRRPYRQQPQYGPQKPVAEMSDEELRDRFLSGPQDNGVEALERFRLNQVDAFYRGTSTGALRLSALASIYRTEDPPDIDPERKRVNEEMRSEYRNIVADLMAFEAMQSFGSTWEAAVALGGQFTGSLAGPENWLGWNATGTLLRGTLKAAGQQAAITAVVDPIIQGMNVQAGVQDEYEFAQTLLSGAMGGGIGAGFHLLGRGFSNVMSQVDRRVYLERLSRDHADFYNSWLDRELAGVADWQQRGSFERPDQTPSPVPEPIEPPPAPRAEAEPEPRTFDTDQYGPGPGHSFDDAVKTAKDEIEGRSGAARMKGNKLREAAQFEAFTREVGEDLQRVLDREGLRPQDVDDLWRYYDRQPGEHPYYALERAFDRRADELTREQIGSLEDSLEWQRDMAEFDRALASEYYPGNARSEYWQEAPQLRNTGAHFGGFAARVPGQTFDASGWLTYLHDMGLAEYEIPFSTGSARDGGGAPAGGPAQPEGPRGAAQGGAGATVGGVGGGEGRAAPAGGGGAGGIVGGPAASSGEPVRGDITPGRMAAAREAMPEDVRAEFDMLVAMGAAKKAASEKDERAFLALLDKYAPAAREGADVRPEVKQGPAEPGRLEERPLLDTPEASPEELARRQRAREKEEAEARMRGRQRSGVGQESAEDTPLFGGERQKDIFGLQGGTGERPDLQALAQRRGGGALFNEQERPDIGIPAGLSPERQAAVMSLQQQTTALARDFNVPVRQGRVEMRGALGTYNNRSGVIRVQEYPDFEVVTHEIGHSLEAIVGRELTDLTQQFGYELARLDYDQDPTTGMRVNEGFAEYIRYFIGRRNDPNIPEGAMNWAPTFTTEFLTLMERERPDLLAALNRAGAAYYAYNQATSIDAVGSVRRVRHESQTFGERMAEAFYDLPNTIRTVFIKGYEILFDSNNDMARFVREMGRLIRENEGGGPVRLEDAYNPDVLLRLFPRSQQAAVGDMIRGVMRYHSLGRGGVSLSEAMSYALNDDRSGWGQWDREMHANFSTYLIAKNAEYLWRRFNAGELPNPPVAFNHGDAMQAMTDLETQFPRFRLASEMVHQYSRDLLGKLYDAGIMSADLHNTLTGREFYVPFMRDLSDKPMTNAPHAASIGGPGATEVIKRLRGSARDIFDPIESLMMQTFLVERVVQHNDIVRSMVRMSERAGAPGGRWVEVVPANEMRGTTFNLGEAIRRKAREIGMADDEAEAFVTMMADLSGEDPLLGRFWQMERTEGRGEPIVFYREGGELRAVRVSSNRREGELGLAELLTQAPPAVTDVFHNMAALSANVMRSGITSAPAYLIANFARDQMAAFLLRSDYVPFVGGIRGAVDELRQSQNALLYGYMGGVAGGASVGPVERAVEANVNALRARNYAVTRFGDRTPAGVAKGLLELTSITEAGTRNSIFSTVFDAAQRRGLSEWEAAVEAAYQAQDILDFSRHGSRTMALRNWVPFMNAHLQGLDKARRTIIDPIVRQMREGAVFERDTAAFNNALASLVKVAGVGVGLGAVYAALNWEKDTYRNASSYLKGTHIVVPMGGKEVAIVPKPFELSLGFTLGEYAYAWLAQNDERAAEQFGEAAWQVLLPPVPWTGMPLMTIPLELKTGVSLFTGREIVPSKLRNLPSEMQYDDRTSEIAKYLGAQLGMSPAKIDFAIGSQFGTMGRDFMALSSGINPDTPAKSWYDVAIMRRFIKDPTRSSDATTRFWDFMARETGKYNRNVNGYDQLIREFRDEEARTLLSKLPASEKAFVTLKSAADEDGKPAFSADDRRLHPLQRAYDAVTTLNGIRQELSANRFAPYASGERVRLSPEVRRDLLENIRELGQIEMANALNVIETPGYKGLPILDPRDAMAKIRALSPAVADEIATRYATQKIYKTDQIIKAWPRVRDTVVRLGSKADLTDIRGTVMDAGYEFEGERVRKPLKRRVPIGASP